MAGYYRNPCQMPGLKVSKLACIEQYLARLTSPGLKELCGGQRRGEANAEQVLVDASAASSAYTGKARLEEERKTEVLRRWRNRGGEADRLRTKERKARKARRENERLKNLVLQDAPNQAIPRASSRVLVMHDW
ncbi:hypothetical protein OBBRIDRAFT_823999 [Obba rivulosa]|uniref:Uncharacterized protein n=1 Tax=Obba rivulosa TaxID=1052685 RepID=A0A8E2DPY8_9APHY|nr:hypothetical protein OBBRIDRAFT_823999 [Obba rivulosa]